MKNEEITISDVTKTEEYVSLENAQLLKKVGFDWLCLCRYIYGIFVPCDSQMRMFYHKNSSTNENECTCPTIQKVRNWLRTEYNIDIVVMPSVANKNFEPDTTIYPVCDGEYEWMVIKGDGSATIYGYNVLKRYCSSFGEACQEAIKYCITNIIQKIV